MLAIGNNKYNGKINMLIKKLLQAEVKAYLFDK